MYIDDYVVLAVHCPVLTVMESIRFAFACLLPGIRIRQTLHSGFLPSAGRWIVIVVVKWLLAKYFPVQVDLSIQILDVFLWCLLDRHKYFPVLVGFCLDMR